LWRGYPFTEVDSPLPYKRCTLQQKMNGCLLPQVAKISSRRRSKSHSEHVGVKAVVICTKNNYGPDTISTV